MLWLLESGLVAIARLLLYLRLLGQVTNLFPQLTRRLSAGEPHARVRGPCAQFGGMGLEHVQQPLPVALVVPDALVVAKHAKEFYRRAKQYRSSGIWKISRDEFCRLLGVSDSTAKSTANLNMVVLKTIAEECGPLLGLKIERQYVKRRLSGFVFTFARETPPVIDARPVEARKTDGDGKGHWTSVAGYGEVFTTTELFDVTAARDHFDGTVEAGECRFCAFDARNREHHARNAGRLF